MTDREKERAMAVPRDSYPGMMLCECGAPWYGHLGALCPKIPNGFPYQPGNRTFRPAKMERNDA